MTAPRIAAVVLAAGLSSRCSGNKLLQLVDGKPVVRHTVEAALASIASPVIVVAGNDATEVLAAVAGLPVTIAINDDYASGLSSSLKCGVKCVPADSDGLIVALGDMPYVPAAIFDRLINAFAETGGKICVPVHDGHRGNPVLWDRCFLPEILALTGDKGAKSIIQLHSDLVFELEVLDDSILIDIDTPDDLGHRPA